MTDIKGTIERLEGPPMRALPGSHPDVVRAINAPREDDIRTLTTAFRELEAERDRLREELARASRGAENMATILELSPPPMEKTIEVLRAIASHAAAALEPKP